MRKETRRPDNGDYIEMEELDMNLLADDTLSFETRQLLALVEIIRLLRNTYEAIPEEPVSVRESSSW